MTIENYIENLFWIKGKTIAIVYNFEGETYIGAQKYDFWEGDVVADWIHAVYELHGIPFVIDARTFVEKAMSNTLPPIDYVVDLNDGFFNLSSLALTPATCSYCGIPCIPCNASILLLGENKFYSNILARDLGFNLPAELNKESNISITRPYCLGSSCGVKKGIGNNYDKKIIQEFIPGFDVTVPILYCPVDEELQVLPAVAYCHDNYDPNWFLGEQQKKAHIEYEKRIITIDHYTQEIVKKFAYHLDIDTYCRIDFRCKCESSDDIEKYLTHGVTWEMLYFLEINPLPTIKEGINFITSLSQVDAHSSISICFDKYKSNTREATFTGFILSSSILSKIKAKH